MWIYMDIALIVSHTYTNRNGNDMPPKAYNDFHLYKLETIHTRCIAKQCAQRRHS